MSETARREQDSPMSDGMTLTFKGDSISAKPFADGLRAFVAMVNAVSSEMTGSSHAYRWTIQVHAGSVSAVLMPQALSPQSVTPSDLMDTCERGLIALEHGQTLPAHFPQRAVSNVRKMATTLTSGKHGINGIHVSRGSREHVVTMLTLANIDTMQGVEYRDWGTIEGTLESLSGRGGLTFTVYDRLTGRGATCHFDDEMIEEITPAFTRRVSVSGLIRFRADGEPVAIDVEEFRILPREEDLPEIEDMVGILSGGM